MYKVTKRFDDSGITRINGELVNGTGYKLLDKLVANRYLTWLDYKVKPVKCELCDRQFIDQETLEAHYLLSHPNDVEITDENSGKE